MFHTWETIVDDHRNSVRRMKVQTGWLYQVQDGRKYSSISGTIGRENDQGVPTWSIPVFVPEVTP